MPERNIQNFPLLLPVNSDLSNAERNGDQVYGVYTGNKPEHHRACEAIEITDDRTQEIGNWKLENEPNQPTTGHPYLYRTPLQNRPFSQLFSLILTFSHLFPPTCRQIPTNSHSNPVFSQLFSLFPTYSHRAKSGPCSRNYSDNNNFGTHESSRSPRGKEKNRTQHLSHLEKTRAVAPSERDL